ncbi:hypothetical protein [Turneriella parva]|uniref:GyrI-like small molecule binding domain-containing protein n=1 Tax=Turneriella parva (strain ATCC BAA-1111 / DSM 21527 / NCTC 11395 / H) TaxID=869212 RepID=I4B6Z9_TURPD|nr:hypothetical protein [Turneriella parva]AFM13056.1 hypothetical protein Turpa_2414 [Turneriella parva DSM 21527]
MKAIKIIAAIIIVLVSVLFGMYIWLGGFRSVTVTRSSFGPAEIVFATHKGAYKNLSTSWSAFQKEWQAAGLKDCKALAIYLDTPETPEDKLRSVIGCDISNLDDALKMRLRSMLRYLVIPKSTTIAATFPYKNPASYFIGPMRVYPAFKQELAKEKIVPPLAIETYGYMSAPAPEMGYAMPLDLKREDFAPLFDAFK